MRTDHISPGHSSLSCVALFETYSFAELAEKALDNILAGLDKDFGHYLICNRKAIEVLSIVG